MKTRLIIALALLVTITGMAQQSINYKAIVKDGSGNVVANDLIVVQFQILQGVGMTNVYQESHTPTTDANGLIILNIGEGGIDSGVFAEINWGADDHYLNVQINTGAGLTDMGTTQFMAVPYALSVSSESVKINDLKDGKSDNDGTQDGSSLFLGKDAGLNDDSTDNLNVGVGFEVLKFNTIGIANAANGAQALTSNTEGSYNTANGYAALNANTVGDSNTANGSFALISNDTGDLNTAIGAQALINNATGMMNTANGFRALLRNTAGNLNTAHGYQAGYHSLGDLNVYIGANAGYNETGSNKLYIENSDVDADSALIYGEFDTDILRTNGELQIGNPATTGFAFPTVDGSTDQVLQTDGSGNLSWAKSVSGLEQITEGANTGWRLIGRAPNNYGNIGDNAVDLTSRSVLSGNAGGATGKHSIAMGSNTTASGMRSTAMGFNALATGDYSTALGISTRADSFASLAIGTHNKGGGWGSGWVDTDKLFEIGIGTPIQTKNALTVLKNGQLILTPEHNDATLADGSGYLIIGEESGINLVLDNNEIMARNNGGTYGLALQVDGGAVYVGGAVVHSSDLRLKEDITELPYGLKEVLQLQPKSYYWKNREQEHKSLGLIAQDVQSIINEVVTVKDDKDKTLGISYTELIPVLIKAIQEQQAIIEGQNKENKNLEARLTKVEQLLFSMNN